MTPTGNDMTASDQPPASAIATARLPGVDVARALAVLGMVLVNYKMMMSAILRGPDWLIWLSSFIDGRAAALFVVLAGVGISLRSRRAREDRAYLSFERVSLLKRAAVLFVAGLLHLHIWIWDILHFYGVYLSLAAFLLNVRTVVLWLLALGCLYMTEILFMHFNFSSDASVWSPYGMMIDLLFDGMHPVFPWMTFLLVGMVIGRQDLRQPRIRVRMLVIALVVVVGCAIFNTTASTVHELMTLAGDIPAWLDNVLLSPEVVEIYSSTGTAVATICLCLAITERRAEHRWVTALVATGQLAFTLYIAHAVAILIPLQHELFLEASITVSIAYSLAFYGVAVMLCVWWRKRWPYGPLEGIIRKITGRTTPAPWGGERLP